MIRKQVTNQYSVSEQITLEDVDALAKAGVTLIICNRPDHEEADQLSFSHIAERAKSNNIKALHIPFVVGKMESSTVEAFAQALKKDQTVHAYCRTGNRSNLIWQAINA